MYTRRFLALVKLTALGAAITMALVFPSPVATLLLGAVIVVVIMVTVEELR
jgi:hypothetical protein